MLGAEHDEGEEEADMYRGQVRCQFILFVVSRASPNFDFAWRVYN